MEDLKFLLIGCLIGIIITLVWIGIASWLAHRKMPTWTYKFLPRKPRPGLPLPTDYTKWDKIGIKSGAENCRGEWKDNCPYMVCECAKRKFIALEEDYRQDYNSIALSVAFWVFMIGGFIVAGVILYLNW